jgi:hypothetical protein
MAPIWGRHCRSRRLRRLASLFGFLNVFGTIAPRKRQKTLSSSGKVLRGEAFRSSIIQRSQMKRAVGIVAMLLLPSCGAVPQQHEAQLLLLETVEKGHLCDPQALMQAIAREHPGIDPETARRETDHLLYVLGCNLPSSTPPEPQEASSAPSAADFRLRKKKYHCTGRVILIA